MLPEFLHSAFKTYKEDTNVVATWLAVEAKEHGYHIDLLQEPRATSTPSSRPSKSTKLKGKARTMAKQQAQGKLGTSKSQGKGEASACPTHVIRIRDFVPLAEFISGLTKPVCQVPSPVSTALNRAIELRRLHNIWACERGLSSKEHYSSEPGERIKSNETHSYFLGILEQTRDILQSHLPVDTSSHLLSKPLIGSSTDIKGPRPQEYPYEGNVFELLDLEEPSQDFMDVPGARQAGGAKPSSEPRYQAEDVQTPEEIYLAAQCLLRDVSRVRQYVRGIWARYRERRFNLMAVSIATDTAIDLVRAMEQEWTQRFPGISAYDKILQVSAGYRGSHEEDPERPDNPINFRTYDHADDYMLSTYTILQHIQNAIKPGIWLICKFGQAGDRDTTKSRKSARVKLHDDRSILAEHFSDLHNIMVYLEGGLVIEDNLIRGIREMAPGRDIPLSHLLATQIFLDIYHVLEDDLGRGQADLTRTATAMKATIEANFDFHSSLRTTTWPKENDALMRDLLEYIDSAILQDTMTEISTKWRMDSGLPNAEPFRLLRRYPLYCGLSLFNLKVRFQELSIAFANAWPSVISTAHLYNAVRKERLLNTEWKDLELVIKLQGAEALFVGGRPNSVKEYYKRYLLSIGISATMFASNRRQNLDWARAKRGARALRALGQVANLFRGRYVDNEASVAFTRESIEPLIQAKIHNESIKSEKAVKGCPGKYSKASNKGKQAISESEIQDARGNSRTFPMLNFLDKIVNLVDKEQLEMSVDYLHIHRTSFRLVRRVKDACNTKLGTKYGDVNLTKERQLPFLVGVILGAAAKISRTLSLLQPKRTSEAINPALALHGTVLEEFITEEGCGLGVRLLGEVYRDNMPFEVWEEEAEEGSCGHTSAT
ncbi:MAG: hypothetical protein Q9201_001093 [Fulgogasparrea decipioides]